MNASLLDAVAALRTGWSGAALSTAFDEIMDGRADETEVTSFLGATIPFMREPEALMIGARALRTRMLPVTAPVDAIDVCGTGGDGAQTLNVSTAVAFILAGAGVCVAKHGNRAMTSKSGAADVLESLGVRLTNESAVLERALREAGVAFLFAQHHHPAMRHVAAARRALGKRTLFNLLGPLSNPADVRRQLLGVFEAESVEPVALALQGLGAEAAWVVHGEDGVDEVTLGAPTRFARFTGSDITHERLAPESFGLGSASVSELRGGTADENATELRTLLKTPEEARPAYRAVVLANAIAALILAGRADAIAEARDLAIEALHSGAGARALAGLIEITQEAA